MAFRANEAENDGFDRAQKYLIPRDLDGRSVASRLLKELVKRHGPVVESYPSWHPLVSRHDPRLPVTIPSEQCGYRGLDHTIYFRDGFVSCPYGEGAQAVLDSVDKLKSEDFAAIRAEKLNVLFYHKDTTAVLVYCDWDRPLEADGTIPKSLAVPLFLEKELPCWRWAQAAETWESMRYYLLGGPCGSRSSLFVNQETGAAMKRIWRQVIESGAFGPIRS